MARSGLKTSNRRAGQMALAQSWAEESAHVPRRIAYLKWLITVDSAQGRDTSETEARLAALQAETAPMTCDNQAGHERTLAVKHTESQNAGGEAISLGNAGHASMKQEPGSPGCWGYVTYTTEQRIADLVQRISSSRRCGFGESYIAKIQAELDDLRGEDARTLDFTRQAIAALQQRLDNERAHGRTQWVAHLQEQIDELRGEE